MKNKLQQKLLQIWQLRRALGLVWQSAPGWAIASLVLAIAQGILPLFSLYLMKLLIDAITAGIASPVNVSAQGIIVLIVAAGMVALLSEISAGLMQFVGSVQAQTITDYVRHLLHQKSVEVDLEYYENAHYYDALHLAQQEAPYRPQQLLDALIRLGQSVVSLLAILLLLLTLHWAVPLILFMTALPALVIRFKYANQVYRKQQEWTPQERQADYYTWLLTGLASAKEIRLFNLGSLFQRRFRMLRQQIRQEKQSLALQRFFLETGIQALAAIAVFGVCGFLALQALAGAITIGGLVMYFQAFQRGQAALRDSLSQLASLYENSLFLTHLYTFLDLPPRVVDPDHPKQFPVPIQQGICFEQIQFRYPHSTRSLLEDIHLTIRAGETIALVGENGAGKTTLIKLLCRLYDPTAGRITIDGIDLRHFAIADLRQQISVLFQDYAHYNLTVAENIGVGDLDQISDRAAVQQAAAWAGADRTIARLSAGYDTLLGREYEEGEELSIGEWQKIALARAFLRQAQIVILDEPTSALDARSEHEVGEQFHQLTQGRAAILISHRLSTVKLADRIYLLQQGRIVESGTHDQLIQQQGAYAHLFQLQASSYR